MRKKLFDQKNNRLLYVEHKADEQFWDEKWAALAVKTFAKPPSYRAVINITKRYLPFGARLLEGGCGLGGVVHALDKAGYKVDGVDYAPRIVKAINNNWPHLSVREGDVRHLPFNDNYYDGYWSLGVIEHFPSGYEEVALEMKRILRSGGYLFLSFPVFNRLRQLLAKRGKFQVYKSDPCELPDFYQFALDLVQVCVDFEAMGFELLESRGSCSLQCLEEDLICFQKIQCLLGRLYPKLSIAIRAAINMIIDVVLGNYVGHSCLLVLRKK